jgi:hypothetical protein
MQQGSLVIDNGFGEDRFGAVDDVVERDGLVAVRLLDDPVNRPGYSGDSFV